MISRVDLHVHTTASDGHFSPSEVVRRALDLGLTVLAITDHDTIGGIEEALQAAQGTSLEVIPGVEISTDIPGSEAHVLGYYVDHAERRLTRKLELFRDSRFSRAQGMVAKLAAMGLPLDWERVRQIAGGGAFGRPHVAQAMLEMGYVSSTSEAFDLYIGRNGPAYVNRYKMTPSEAVQIILDAHGLPVLAHPLSVSSLVPELARKGLVGLEAYYTGYSADEVRFLVDLAAKHDLLVTGGSDFHGDTVLPQNRLGGVVVPPEVVEELRARHRCLRPA